MRVYDLFSKIYNNVELKQNFYDVYVAAECQSCEFPRKYDEQVKFLRNTRAYLDDAFEEILKRKPKKDDGCIVLVWKEYETVFEPFENKYCYTSSLVHVNDLLAHKDTGIDESKYDDPKFIETYAYEFSEMEEILGWKVSDVCLDKWGILTCAMAIFTELTFNGIYQESRDERKDELDASIKEFELYEDNPEEYEKHFVPGDVVMAELKEHMYDSCETEDERKYYKAKDKFDDMFEAEVKEITDRRTMERLQEDRAQREEILRAELKLLTL